MFAAKPVTGEFVECYRPVRNGDNGFRRGVDRMLAKVVSAAGSGVVVRPWHEHLMKFGEAFWTPSDCIVCRIHLAADDPVIAFQNGQLLGARDLIKMSVGEPDAVEVAI